MPKKNARSRHRPKHRLPVPKPRKTEVNGSAYKRRKTTDSKELAHCDYDYEQSSSTQSTGAKADRLLVPTNQASASCYMVSSDETDSLVCTPAIPDVLCQQQYDPGTYSSEDEIVDVLTDSSDSPQVRDTWMFRERSFLASKVFNFHPLPAMDWADGQDVWDALREKEDRYIHSMDMFDQHPDVKPNMRAVLLSWLSEVCEVYSLHRETYYMAVEFIDRFLCSTLDVKTSRLQLIGVTALFMASKIEEIYPPKLKDFAYVTDGACSEEEIRDFELFLSKMLDWRLSPVTPNTWLQIYLQVETVGPAPPYRYAKDAASAFAMWSDASSDLDTSANSGVSDLVSYTQTMGLAETECADKENMACGGAALGCCGCCVDDNKEENPEEKKADEADPFMTPVFSKEEYVQVSQLLDLVILDSYSLHFNYSLLAAAALYLTKTTVDVRRVCALNWTEVESCAEWMKIHKAVLETFPPKESAVVPVYAQDKHKIQTHSVREEAWQTALGWSEHYFQSNSAPLMMLPPVDQSSSPPQHQTSSKPDYMEPNFITPPNNREKASHSRGLR